MIKMKLPKEIREKGDLGGASSSKNCSVRECGETAIRSLSENKWSKVCEKLGFRLDENKQHKIFLCKKHYKEANKVRKSDEKLMQKKGFLQDDRSASKTKIKRFD